MTVKKRGRPAKKVAKKVTPQGISVDMSVNWEDLAKKLQEALAKEMKESQALQAQMDIMRNAIMQGESVIQYLEQKLWNLFNTKR